MKNRTMILQFEEGDEAFAEGGALADKKWIVGEIGIFAKAGMSHFNVVENDGREIKICVSVRDPYLIVAAANNQYTYAPFDKPFNLQEFEGKLQEAKDAVDLMNIFLDDAYDEVLDSIFAKRPQ